MAHIGNDFLLSEFIRRSGSEPGLARDMLDASNWNLDVAMQAFVAMTVDDRRSMTTGTKGVGNKSQSSYDQDAMLASLQRVHVTSSIQEDRVRTISSVAQDSLPTIPKPPALRHHEPSKSRKTMTSRSCSLTSEASGFRSSSPSSASSYSAVGQLRGGERLPFHLSMVLPDFRALPKTFVEYIEEGLLDITMLNALESSGSLNWLAEKAMASRLFPLRTTGDGNCLLHSASLAMWGYHDRLLHLRSDVEKLLTGAQGDQRKISESICRRWAWEISWRNANNNTHLVYSEEEWEREWAEVTAIASDAVISSGADGSPGATPLYGSLEEVHIFTLAHVLRRPVVVIADKYLLNTRGEKISPIEFGGIYLPLLLKPERCCSRIPIVLGYDSLHFSALAPVDRSLDILSVWQPSGQDLKQHIETSESQGSPALSRSSELRVLPLEREDGELLPVMFSFDPGCGWPHYKPLDVNGDAAASFCDFKERRLPQLMSRYLNLVEVPVNEQGSRRCVVCADMSLVTRPPHLIRTFNRYMSAKEAHYAARQKQGSKRHCSSAEGLASHSGADDGQTASTVCSTEGCAMFGTKQQLGLCSRCYHRNVSAFSVSSPSPAAVPRLSPQHGCVKKVVERAVSAPACQPAGTRLSRTGSDTVPADWVDVSDYDLNGDGEISTSSSPEPLAARGTQATTSAFSPSGAGERSDSTRSRDQSSPNGMEPPATPRLSTIANLRLRFKKLKVSRKKSHDSLGKRASRMSTSSAATSRMSSSSVPTSRMSGSSAPTSSGPVQEESSPLSEVRYVMVVRGSGRSAAARKKDGNSSIDRAAPLPSPLSVLEQQQQVMMQQQELLQSHEDSSSGSDSYTERKFPMMPNKKSSPSVSSNSAGQSPRSRPNPGTPSSVI